MIEITILAPSAKNRQPWKFKIITDKSIITQISEFVCFSKWIQNVPCQILVFLDKQHSYDYIKDVQSYGAVIQNLLLAAHSINISACWVGEILERSEEVLKILNLSQYDIELMAMVTLGYGENSLYIPHKRKVSKFILN